jgi:hypothetical protein
MKHLSLLFALIFVSAQAIAQDYFLKRYQPYEDQISSPEEFLGYGIGEQHTRHDLIVSYLSTLASQSERAKLIEYGRTHEGRKLVMLVISSPENLNRLDDIQKEHLKSIDPLSSAQTDLELPLIVNLAYNVHGNEPSSSEAALLSAYTLTASENEEIMHYLDHAVVFIDPTINPDGRDRHTYWANMYKGAPLVADPQDAEHNEYWPGGRTNHYWFDLNRDWILAVNPESQGKLNWYHQWYPNVVTDFHEMGSQSTYFFEPMKPNGSKDPIMPKENYEDLNELFGGYFSKALDSIGSFYFSREVFDGTYPGYGSSYPDLQGGLGLLFEQASSRGLKQTTAFGEITFPFTIRNQYVSSITTLKAAVENKAFMREYQRAFFESAISRSAKDPVKAYTFNEPDRNKAKAFLKLMERHKVDVFTSSNGTYVIPTKQPQYRIVQTAFETYEAYRDSVYYDASAWSLANFYQLKYSGVNRLPSNLKAVKAEELKADTSVSDGAYAYIVDAVDYNLPAFTYALQKEGLVPTAAFKPFSVQTDKGVKQFNYGSLIVPISLQKKSPSAVQEILEREAQKFNLTVYAAATGWSSSGVDLGSRFMMPLKTPKAAMIIGNGTRSYEAGEVWHLLDTRIGMPITKIPVRNLSRASLDPYNVLVLVSGSYPESFQSRLKEWVAKGNTLITIGTASTWAISKTLVEEALVDKPEVTETERLPYVESSEHIGRESLGGVFVNASLDLTHPLGFGYTQEVVPFYKNNTNWIAPSKNSYATVARYTEDAHVDGYISEANKRDFLGKSAAVLVSRIGSGRVILFADDPNFRGTTYGMNRMFLNALFLGQHIEVPRD